MAFNNPAREKTIEVINNVTTTIVQECISSGTKNSETRVTNIPTQIPRATPPPTNPAITTWVGTGDTNNSSILRWNLAPKMKRRH